MAREVITTITTVLPRTIITTARHIIQAQAIIIHQAVILTAILTARATVIIITAIAPRLQ